VGNERGFATRAVHGANAPEVHQVPASVPIYQTATWRFDTSEEFADVSQRRRPGQVYSRGFGNPTVDALEHTMADLESTAAAMGFASGMAAIYATITTLAGAGRRIVASRELYGGTFSLFSNVLPRYGVDVTFVDPHDPGAVANALPGAACFYVETITNPLVTVADLSALAHACRDAGVACVVDNTFASPYLCNPAALGFDLVLHSATKYIGGHGDLIGGVVCGSADVIESVRSTAIDTGGTMQPLEAWLCLRGLATLAIRMDQHGRSAARLAGALDEHPRVQRVHYPGLPGHPHHEIARKQLRGFGGMLAFEVPGGVGGGARVADALELAWIGGSLGTTRTLVAHPASTTHRQLDPDARMAAGIGDGLLRVSVGLEDPDDLIDDFTRALEAV
jgi:cystathionine beta-lyase/cystathionine gamma-synthase